MNDYIITNFYWQTGSVTRLLHINKFELVGYQEATKIHDKLNRELFGQRTSVDWDTYRLISYLKGKGVVTFDKIEEIERPTEQDLLFAEAEEWEKTLTDKEREYISALGRRFIATAG